MNDIAAASSLLTWACGVASLTANQHRVLMSFTRIYCEGKTTWPTRQEIEKETGLECDVVRLALAMLYEEGIIGALHRLGIFNGVGPERHRYECRIGIEFPCGHERCITRKCNWHPDEPGHELDESGFCHICDATDIVSW